LVYALNTHTRARTHTKRFFCDTTFFILPFMYIRLYSSCRRAASEVSNWTKVELQLEAKGTNRNSRLQLTTNQNRVIWLDQVSVMPTDTYKVYT